MELHNPVLSGFNPDPSIIRVGSDYYLATSSFEYLPGIPIYKSQDLRSWQLIGNVATRPGQLDVAGVATGLGAWAPTLRFHAGKFWLVITVVGQGCIVFTAENPAGPWSDPVQFKEVLGIDPDLAWDEDGTCYLTFSGLMVAGGEISGGYHHMGIQQVRVNPETGEVFEEPRSLWAGTGLMFPEAPHLYRIGDYWYLMIAEGGTERGHCVSISRSTSPMGPFEGCPRNPVLSARSTNRPIQNTGHGDLVQTPEGQWVMICLGMRTRSGTRAFSPMGRETFGTTLVWEDGWPVVEPVILSDPGPAVAERQNFDLEALPQAWIGIRRFPHEVSSLTERPGWLTMTADGSTMSDLRPVFIGQRQRHEHMLVTTRTDVSNGVGGLVLRLDEHQYVQVLAGNDVVEATVHLHELTDEVEAGFAGDTVQLFIRTTAPGAAGNISHGPDKVIVGYISGGEEVELLKFDGRYICAETGESFVGRAYGLVATEGTVAFDYVTYDGVDGPRP